MKKILITLAVLCTVGVLPAEFSAGFARLDVTPPLGIPNVLQLPIDPAYAQAIDAGAAESLALPEIDAFIDPLI